MAPLGMVRLGPETRSFYMDHRALNSSGYYFGDDLVLGFSHTRLNGTGATDGGHLLVLPSATPHPPGRQKAQHRFGHGDETAFPGYYAVRLPEPGILVELTATRRVGVHRYTFGGTGERHLFLDAGNALGGKRSEGTKVRILPGGREMEGSVRTFGTFAGRYGGLDVYFVARWSLPITGFATWDDQSQVLNRTQASGSNVGLDLTFAPGPASRVLELYVGISHVSLDNARANLDSEVGREGFDAILARTRTDWEQTLGRVRVEGGTERDRTLFQTALFRVFEMPTLFTDVNGDYVGLDGRVHQARGFEYYTDLSIWDTFRTVHPLLCLIAPDVQQDVCRSLTRMVEQGGWLPRWPSGHGYANSMFGTPGDVLIADSYLRGIRGFEVETVYEAMRRTALGPTPPGAKFSGREGIEAYLQFGYCPTDQVRKSVAYTLEYGWSDQSLANLAEALGKTDDAALFRKHAGSYKNLWNPGTLHFQPRDSRGRFKEPFKPHLLTYLDWNGRHTSDYVEGSALQWRWGAPYDARGMIGLYPSRERFVQELGRFFSDSDPAMGAWSPGPYYWHGNQPDLHAAYLFIEAGRPDRTQYWVRWILQHKYGTGADGLDGNDDGGTLSAWYVLSALGLYPDAGSDRFWLGSPLFPKADVPMGKGRLEIRADGASDQACFVQGIWLNGQRLDRHWVRMGELAGGGVLRFEMSTKTPLPEGGVPATL